jgi:hypothetical protein
MSKYYLTEAYGELYNPRKADETFYENLRFVDYLMQEEIEEVMESLLWEFMDYGNNLDESYGLIQGVFSDDVILEEVLTEARMTPRQKAERAARVGAQRQETLKQVAGQKATQRREARKAAVVRGLKKAKETVGKAASNVGSAAMGAMRDGKQAAAGAYERAKGLPGKAMAALKGLARKGAAAAIKSGRSAERAGKEAERTTITTTSTSGGGRGVAPSTVTTKSISGGAKRRALGRILKGAGKAIAGAMKSKPSRMTRGEYEERKAGRAAAARSAADTTSTPPSSPRRYPTEPSGQTTLFTQAPKGKEVGAEVKVPSGGQRRFGAKKKPKKGGTQRTLNLKRAGYSEPTVQKEDFELLAQYILEDFINEGYADTYEDAFEILENLSESSIVELTEMYLEG